MEWYFFLKSKSWQGMPTNACLIQHNVLHQKTDRFHSKKKKKKKKKHDSSVIWWNFSETYTEAPWSWFDGFVLTLLETLELLVCELEDDKYLIAWMFHIYLYFRTEETIISLISIQFSKCIATLRNYKKYQRGDELYKKPPRTLIY